MDGGPGPLADRPRLNLAPETLFPALQYSTFASPIETLKCWEGAGATGHRAQILMNPGQGSMGHIGGFGPRAKRNLNWGLCLAFALRLHVWCHL